MQAFHILCWAASDKGVARRSQGVDMRVVSAMALVLLGGLVACSKTEPAPDPVRAVRTLTVASDSAGGSFEFAGEVRARTESRLGFRVGGKLVRRLVELGQTVKAGQVLAQLDPQDLKLGQDSASAALLAAQVNLDQAQADYTRFKELRDQGFISSADLERRETTLKAAKAQADQAKAQVSTQANQTSYANLLADNGGVITGIDVDPGTVVAAGTPVLRLAHNGPRDVVFSLPEDKLGLVKKLAGQPDRFKVRLWGSNVAPLSAQIREISAAADPVTRTFLVKADVGAAPLALGQTGTVIVDLPKQAGVVKLPLSALFEQQGKTAVWVVDAATLTVKDKVVQVAGADGNEAVITAGLNPGAVVVTAGVHVLTPGQKVKFYVETAAHAASGAASSTAVSLK